MDKIFELIEREGKRQSDTLMMIPSENYTYQEVRDAVGSILMHKYAEGYPGKRYYQGNKVVDEVEEMCRARALEAFHLDAERFHANVQPHSGCEANLAVYNTLLSPGDRILALYLPDGGHLSHGWHMPDKKTTFVSKIFEVQFYKVDEKTKLLDYDQIEKQAMEFKPKLIISGGTAYPREIDYKRMGEIAKKAGAYYLADVAHEAGLIAAGALSSPFEYADMVSMTTHKTLRGPRGAIVICKTDWGHQLDMAIMPGLQGGPHLHTIAGIAIALEKTKTKEFKDYAFQTVKNAKKLAEVLKSGGINVVSGETDKHLVLIEVETGKGGEIAQALEEVGIIVNKNTVPGEKGSPVNPSGVRMGTPACTVRGMKEPQMEEIGGYILRVIEVVGTRINYEKEIKEIGEKVLALARKFPIPE
jgi:glycine hydroxymethyltransferase